MKFLDTLGAAVGAKVALTTTMMTRVHYQESRSISMQNLVLTASMMMLDAQQHSGCVEKKLANLFDVFFSKAVHGILPALCGRLLAITRIRHEPTVVNSAVNRVHTV